jgi:predicted lipoprotein with Yx(FWY)xxD motif
LLTTLDEGEEMARPTKHVKLILPVGAAVATTAAIVAVIGSTGAAAKSRDSAMAAGKGTVIGMKSVGGLGSILYAGPKKLTVYAFTADHGSKSACSGACAKAWPPVTTTAKPSAQSGASASDLGTIKRSGGVMQVTYKGHPLYYYGDDKTSATADGQQSNAFGGKWYVLSASGSYVMKKAAPGTQTTTSTEKTKAPPPPEEEKKPAEEKKPTTEWG